MVKTISGFSKLSKTDKINWLLRTYFKNDNEVKKRLVQYWNPNKLLQKKHDEFIEKYHN